MKKINKLLTSSFLVAITSATICAPAATAAPSEAEYNQPEMQNLVASEFNNVSLIDFERIVSKEVADFKAEITLVSKTGSEVVDVTDSSLTVAKALESTEHIIEDYRTSSNEAIDTDTKLKNGEEITLYKSEISGSSKLIKLKAPVEKVETDDLFEGETEVKDKGKDGQALKTIISSKNLSTDSKINEESKVKDEAETKEEKLTVLKTPKPKVILVGTKERPAPTPPPVEAYSNNSAGSSTTSESNSRSNSSSRGDSTSRNGNSSLQRTSVSSPATGSYSSAPTTNNTKVSFGNDGAQSSIAKTALAQVGKPYIWGATGPSAFDCSGFVYWVHAQHGNSVPRTTGSQWIASTPISGSELKAGDILWKPGHIALYVGNGKTVHASSPKTGVIMGTASDMLSRGYKAGRL